MLHFQRQRFFQLKPHLQAQNYPHLWSKALGTSPPTWDYSLWWKQRKDLEFRYINCWLHRLSYWGNSTLLLQMWFIYIVMVGCHGKFIPFILFLLRLVFRLRVTSSWSNVLQPTAALWMWVGLSVYHIHTPAALIKYLKSKVSALFKSPCGFKWLFMMERFNKPS